MKTTLVTTSKFVIAVLSTSAAIIALCTIDSVTTFSTAIFWAFTIIVGFTTGFALFINIFPKYFYGEDYDPELEEAENDIIAEYKAEIADLSNQVIELTNEQAQLQREVTILTDENDDLESNYNRLNALYTRLVIDYAGVERLSLIHI